MGDIIKGIEFLGIPATIAIALVGLFLVLQVIGELCELKGKIVPEFLKVRKYFKRKKQEKEAEKALLERLAEKLESFENHYNPDNIARRNEWMQWVNDRAEKYDEAVREISELTKALIKNTEMTEEMFIQDSRTIILSFAERIGNPDTIVSREECKRVFKVYNKYENFLEEHKKTNGEVDIAIKVIQDGYETRLKDNSFLEDLRGYKINN